MASVGDAPDLEASWQGATSWLMPPERTLETSPPSPPSADLSTSPPKGDLTISDAQKRLAASYSAVPSWLLK